MAEVSYYLSELFLLYNTNTILVAIIKQTINTEKFKKTNKIKQDAALDHLSIYS